MDPVTSNNGEKWGRRCPECAAVQVEGLQNVLWRKHCYQFSPCFVSSGLGPGGFLEVWVKPPIMVPHFVNIPIVL